MRLFRRSRSPGSHQVTIYGKPGCHLCDDALALLKRLDTLNTLSIKELDITSEPRLFRAYDIRIPVLVIDGDVELEAPITEDALRRALR